MDKAIRRIEAFYKDGHSFREYLQEKHMEEMEQFSAKNEQLVTDVSNSVREAIQEQFENQ